MHDKDEWQHFEKSFINTKSMASNIKCCLYFIFLLFIQFDNVNSQSTDDNDKDNNDCGLSNRFAFGLSLTYAGISIFLLFGVSFFSFKSMTGL